MELHDLHLDLVDFVVGSQLIGVDLALLDEDVVCIQFIWDFLKLNHIFISNFEVLNRPD